MLPSINWGFSNLGIICCQWKVMFIFADWKINESGTYLPICVISMNRLYQQVAVEISTLRVSVSSAPQKFVSLFIRSHPTAVLLRPWENCQCWINSRRITSDWYFPCVVHALSREIPNNHSLLCNRHYYQALFLSCSEIRWLVSRKHKLWMVTEIVLSAVTRQITVKTGNLTLFCNMWFESS